jgi:hypothetical protein
MKTTVPRRRNIAGFMDANGHFRPIRSPQYVGTPKRKATARDKKKYSRAKAGDLGKKKQELAREDVFQKEIRRLREEKEKLDKQREREWKEIERDAYGTRSGGRLGQTLVEFVRSEGGINTELRIKRGRKRYGDLANFTFKDSGKRGLVTTVKGKGKSLDYMHQAARQAGFDVTSIDELLDKMDDEIRSGKATRATHGYLDYRDNPKRPTRRKNPELNYSFAQLAADAKKAKNYKFVFPLIFVGQALDYVNKHGGMISKDEKTGRFYANLSPLVVRRTKPKAKRNPPSAARLAKSAIAVFDADLDLDVDDKDLRILEAATRKLRSRKKTTLKRNPYGWFKGVTTLEELKKLYKKLASQHHPDKPGGDTRTMQEINADYDKSHKVVVGNEGNASRASAERQAAKPLREAIEFAVTLPDTIDVVIRGLWLWIEGNTYPIKDRIKSFVASDGKRFKYASKKKAWFFAAVPSSNRRGEMSFDEIDALHGRELVKARKQRLGLKANPIHPLTAFATGASGILSALQIKEMVNRPVRKKAKQRTNPKPSPTEIKRCEKLIAEKKRNEYVKPTITYASNPKPKAPRSRTFEMFQGRRATNAVQMPVSTHAPKTLAQLGDLVELKLHGQTPIKFNGKKFRLCAANGKLWIAGGSFAKPNPAGKANVLNPIAEIDHVVYGTYKPHHGDMQYTHYIHKLGEETGHRPLLCVDKQGYPVIRGGRYKIEARGIVN